MRGFCAMPDGTMPRAGCGAGVQAARRAVFAILPVVILSIMPAPAGAQQPGVGERVGRAIDETAAKTGKAVKEVGAKVTQEARVIGHKVGEAVSTATEKTGQALKAAGSKVEEVARGTKPAGGAATGTTGARRDGERAGDRGADQSKGAGS